MNERHGMNEKAARAFLLVRAVEATDTERRVWSDDDRAWATRAAAEVEGGDASPASFLARRAGLAMERLGARHPSMARALRMVAWRPWIGWAAVLVALVAGVAADQIGAGRRVNILALPLLGLLAWNLLAYAMVLARAVAALTGRFNLSGPLRALLARLGHAIPPSLRDREPIVARALTTFAHDWVQASLPLAAARVSRILHWAAFVFALGVLAGMYARGIVLEYRAGWESTFLEPPAVEAILQTVLGPAAQLTGIALPDAARLEAMRLPQGEGERAAPWLHLYAVTIGLFVLLPRALLAIVTGLLARRRAGRMVDVDADLYAQRLVRQLRGESSQLRVVPYALQLSAEARANLLALVARIHGAKASVEVIEPVAWGGEDSLDVTVGGRGVNAMWALFPAAATPERENHGAFLGRLRAGLDRFAVLLAVVDESAFRRRFADMPGRLEERRAGWQALLDECHVPAVFVDLEQPDLVSAEAAVNAAVERSARSGR